MDGKIRLSIETAYRVLELGRLLRSDITDEARKTAYLELEKIFDRPTATEAGELLWFAVRFLVSCSRAKIIELLNEELDKEKAVSIVVAYDELLSMAAAVREVDTNEHKDPWLWRWRNDELREIDHLVSDSAKMIYSFRERIVALAQGALPAYLANVCHNVWWLPKS